MVLLVGQCEISLRFELVQDVIMYRRDGEVVL